MSPKRVRQRLERPHPAVHRGVELSEECLAVALAPFAVLRDHARQPVEDVLRDRRRETRIERDVRIPSGMDIAHAPVHACGRDLEHRQAAGGVDATGGAAEDARVVRAGDGRIGPGIEIEAVLHDDISPAQSQHHARPNLGVVPRFACRG